MKLEFPVFVKDRPKEEIILKENGTTIHVGDSYQIEYELKNLTGKAEFYTKDLDYINVKIDMNENVFNLTNVVKLYKMFRGCLKLKGVALPKFIMSNIRNKNFQLINQLNIQVRI